MIRALAVLLLVGCGHVPTHQSGCVTEYGTVIIPQAGHQMKFTCDAYNAVQIALHQKLRTKLPNAELHWKGLTVWELPGNSTQLPHTRAAGWTECFLRRVHVHSMTDPAVPLPGTAYAHELIHAAQNCRSPGPTDKDADPDHSDWFRSGFYRIIDELRDLP